MLTSSDKKEKQYIVKMIESYISVSINFYPKFKWIESIHVGHKHGKPVGTGLLNQLSIQGTCQIRLIG